MKFVFNVKGYDRKECDVEVFKNEHGIAVKFFNKNDEPNDNEVINYVFVEAGYGYISLKRKSNDAIISGYLRREFFSNESIISRAKDFVESLVPEMKDAYIPYNFERITVFDRLTYTGETFDDLKEQETKGR